MNIRTFSVKLAPKIIFIAAAISALPIVSSAKPLSYNYVEADYLTDIKPGDGDGWGVTGSFVINPSFFAVGSYSDVDFNGGLSGKTFNAGFGAHTALSEKADVFGTLSYVHAKASLGGSSGSEDGFGVVGGLRGMVLDALELNGSISYVDLGHGLDGSAFGIGAVYDFTDAIAGTVNYSNGENDSEGWSIGLRFNF